MKLARAILIAIIIMMAAGNSSLFGQSTPDLENGFKSYGSYQSSDIDTVSLLNGNLMVHIPVPWTYPQRGGEINPKNLLTMSSKTWQIKCVPMDPNPAACFWTPGSFRDQMVSLAGSGLGFDHTMDLSLHRDWSLNTDFQGNPTYFSGGYSLFTADGASHPLAAKPNAPIDPNGDPMTYDSDDTSGFHVDLSSPDPTDGTPSVSVITDRHGNIYQGGWFTSLPCRTTKASNGGSNEDLTSTKECSQATRLGSITDVNGNVFTNTLDTMGRPFHTYSFISSGPDTSGCVLNGLTFSSSTIGSYAGPNGATNQVKMCYATVNIATAFGVSGVSEAQNATNLGSPATATVLVTLILPDNNNAISASSPKWVFNYDSYINLTYIGLPTGGSISYTWRTLTIGTPCDKISRAVATRTLNDNQGHSYNWNYQWSIPVGGAQANTVTDPLSNDTVHNFTDLTGHNSCPIYETKTQQFLGASSSGQLLKQVDTTYSLTGIGAVPISIQTTLSPSNKVSLITKTYDLGLGPNQPIFGNVTKKLEYNWGQGSPGALLRETDTTYQWQKDSRYLTAHLLDLPASTVVISPDPNGNPKTNCPAWDSNGNATTKACMAETDYTYDEAAYLTGYETTVGALPTGTHVAAPNSVRGNLTSLSKWLSTTNSFIVSHGNWYDTGEPYQAIDPLNHTATHSYDPAYAGAFSTQTCSPTTAGFTHCVSDTYDFQTGALSSVTDENGQTSNFGYDSMGRLILAQTPPDPGNGSARAQTSFTFSPANIFPLSVQRTKSITTYLSDSATNFFDGLGRAYLDQHVLPNGTAKVDTVYDALNRPSSVSNPYFTTSDSTYGTTQTLYDALGRAYQTTKQDGSVSSVDFSAGNCILTTDEAGHQRKGCSDALGRLVEVDEPNPVAGPSSATGTVTINGNEQFSGGVATSGSAMVTLSGNEQSAQYCPLGHCHTIWNTGDVTITVNGFTKSASYSQSVNTPALIASALAGAFHNDPSSPVNGAASGNSVTLTAWAAGGSTNYAFTTSSSTTDPTGTFVGPSFAAAPASGALAGGHDGGVFDSGTLSVAVNGVNYLVSFGTGDTNSSIASRLAPVINTGSWASASATGNQVNLTSKTPGPGGNYSLSSAYTWNSVQFPNPSFTSSASGGGLTGGFNPGNIGDSPYVTLYQYDALGNLLRVDQKGSAPTDSTQWRTRTFTYDSLSHLLTAQNPESGTITYSYDTDGNLLQKTSPAPNQPSSATQTISYCYDELNRVTGKAYGAQTCPLTSPVVSYSYDSGASAKGKLTLLTDQAGTANYSYDIFGRLTTETRTLTGANDAAISKTVSYDYNLDGSLYKVHYPSGAAVTYAPGVAGLTLSAVDSGNGINFITGATYGPDSALTGFVSGNSGTFGGIANSYSYNKRLQPLAMLANAPSQTVFSIGYDFHVGNGTSGADNGNVWGITNYKDTTHGRDQTFTYDALNRLTSAQNAGTNCAASTVNGKTEYWGNNYAYDAWGNLLQKSITKCGAENLIATADAHNWIHASGTDYQYDAAGNMTFDATASLSYSFDQENRLTGASGYTYTYDGNGNRVRKSNGNLAANGTLYWSMTPGVVAETDLAGTLKSEYVFFDSERVARKDFPSNTVAYYFSDNLKTASVITDSAGNIKAESDYYPWGGELQFVNNDSNDYKFTGKKRDTETGLDYFGARYYSNGLGRFVSSDWASVPIPVPYADFGDPQTLNLYTYVRNLPTMKIDADGHWFDADCSVCGPNDSGYGFAGAGSAIGLVRGNRRRANAGLAAVAGRAIGSVGAGIASMTAGAVGATPPPGFLDKLSAFFQGDPITRLDMIEGWKQQAADGLTGSTPTPVPNQGVLFGDPVTVPNGFLWILDVATHGWGVHGPDGEDDLNGLSKDQYTKLILDTVQNASGGDVKHVGPGKTAYWNDKEGFIVVKNKNSPATGTAFFPSEGKDYFDDME